MVADDVLLTVFVDKSNDLELIDASVDVVAPFTNVPVNEYPDAKLLTVVPDTSDVSKSKLINKEGIAPLETATGF
jgi:hypothetical protein